MNTKRRAHCQLWHDWKERIIRIGDEQTSLQNQFDNLRNEFTDNSPRIEALEADVNALDGRLIIAETDIAEAEDRITACENDIDRIDAELVDKTGEINNLANRMSLAEADIDDLDARLEGIEAEEILLSQLNVDTDKDWQGRSISNVDLNNATYGEYHIDPRFLTGDGLIFDGQPGFMNRDLKTINDPQYVEVEGAPHPVALTRSGGFGIGHRNNPEKMVRVSPGERVTLTATVRTLSESSENGKIALFILPYDINKEYVSSKRTDKQYYPDNNSIWQEYSLTYIVPEDIYYIRPYIFVNEGRPEVTSQICDFKIYKDFNRDISAKLATFDGVIIKDGGTVDGVDISTHTHDGTAIGGPKISYNNLVDKPTIPRPPMPFKKSVSINLASPGDYIDVIPGTKYGRTVLTLERLQYRSIANILEGTGAFVVIGLIYDDNTVGTAIDRVTINGDTDWHPPTYYGLNQTYQFTKNYIKGIRIERTPGEGPPITGYVDIIGYLY